ncbi:H-NS family nucleoid-associated regulatory protein [Vibrio harveyi]|uniref:H-NS family histone-like protein n=1 Tax=Vibrio harveyi TaxID=669 RepID=UPI003BB77E58
MQEFLKTFQHLKVLRAALKSVDSKALEKCISKMNVILEEKIEQEELAAKEERERREKVESTVQQVDELLSQAGLDINDLVAIKNTKKLPPKYVLQVGDEEIYYVGTGRMPKEFEEYVANGGDLDELKIQKE